MVSDFQTIRYRRQDDIGTLTLARPGKRNAQNPLMWQELASLGADLLPDETLRCLVVTGEGPAFSAGIDLVEGMAGVLATWAAPVSPPCAVTPTAPACSSPWRATSASSRRARRSACPKPATGSCPTWAPPSDCPGSSARAGHGS